MQALAPSLDKCTSLAELGRFVDGLVSKQLPLGDPSVYATTAVGLIKKCWANEPYHISKFGGDLHRQGEKLGGDVGANYLACVEAFMQEYRKYCFSSAA